MARKKVELKAEEIEKKEILEEAVDLEVKEEALQKELTMDDINSLYEINTSNKKEMSNIINRITYIKNEIRKESYAISNLEKTSLSRELTNVESEKLKNSKLIVVEFERQLKVNDDKISNLSKEANDNTQTINDFLIKYSKEILKNKAELKNKKQTLVKNMVEYVKNIIAEEEILILEGKELTNKVINTLKFGANITNYTNIDVEQARVEHEIEDLGLNDIHIKDLLNRFKDIEKYIKRKGL